MGKKKAWRKFVPQMKRRQRKCKRITLKESIRNEEYFCSNKTIYYHYFYPDRFFNIDNSKGKKSIRQKYHIKSGGKCICDQ